MDQPLQAHTTTEATTYLRVHPCGSCGHGPWRIVAQDARDRPAEDGGRLTIEAVCEQCGEGETLRFAVEHVQTPEGATNAINPGDEPSRIIDLGQWLSLFHLLLEQASRERSSHQARRTGYGAALCLDEALKFYEEDDEVPPEDAFWSEPGRRAFREHPEKFARQRLRDMRAKLPATEQMARRVEQDRRPAKKWWQFWRRD
jgi:hypothetical protein